MVHMKVPKYRKKRGRDTMKVPETLKKNKNKKNDEQMKAHKEKMS